MKNQTKKVLQKAGVILAMVMLFTMLAIPAWADETGSGASTSSSDTTPAPVAGDPYIAAYTVTDAAGTELQRIEEGRTRTGCEYKNHIDSIVRVPFAGRYHDDDILC